MGSAELYFLTIRDGYRRLRHVKLVSSTRYLAQLRRGHEIPDLLEREVHGRAHDLGVDFIGSNLHKWIGAPLGVGFIYVAKSRLADIDRAMGDEDWAPTDIRSRVHTGT